METKRERARPLSPEDRRAAIITATRPLLMEHGRRTTTKLVAEAAGIAEGTIFRVFPTKEELFDAVLDAEFDAGPFLNAVGRIDLDEPLRDRMIAVTTLLQRRFISIFQLMIAMAVPRPPGRLQTDALRKQLATEGVMRVIGPDADRFRVPPEEVVRLLRLLTFSASHPHISENRPMKPADIVDVILHGTLDREEED
jgi:AcrR family transcriptional regulator